MTQPLSQQAVFLCRSFDFQRFVERQRHLLYGCCGEQDAAQWLREQCGITSRGQLDRDPECAVAFDRVLKQYRKELGEEILG